MFKNKKNRDSALLIFMGFVMIVFLIYIFSPNGDKTKTEKTQSKSFQNHKNSKAFIRQSSESNGTKNTETFLKDVKDELIVIQDLITSGESPFFPPGTEKLEELFKTRAEQGKEVPFEKILRFRFRDLDKIFETDFLKSIKNSEKFDIYISLFLLQANKEMIATQSSGWTLKELSENAILKSYKIINFEIQEDYQTIPLYFYTWLFIKKDPIFPPSTETIDFFNKMKKIKDLSGGQILNSLKNITSYSQELKNFSIQWTEYDPLDPDDTGNYKGVKFKVHSWINFKFIVFPGENEKTWIKDLIKSDRGEFELKDLEISEEIPEGKRIVRSILYSSNLSKFIAIIEEPVIFSTNFLIDKLLKDKIEGLKKNFIEVDMLNRYRDKKKFTADLMKFGKYIYKIRPVFGFR